jgi:putative phage-type endonuclease
MNTREEWLAERKKGVGGTDVAAIAGLHPYVSATIVWSDKLGLTEVPENEVMKWGKRLEGAIADEYAEREGCSLIEGKLIKRQRDGVWLMGTPDFLIDGVEKGLEIKTASSYAKGWGKGNADIPQHYYIQCQWYMMLTGFKRWDLAVLIGGNDYRVYRLVAHPGLQAALARKALDFWKTYVEPQVMPKADASDDYKRVVGEKIPKGGDPLLASDELESIAMELATAKTEATHAEKKVKLLQNQLMEAMKNGETDAILGCCWKAKSVKMPGRASTDWKQLIKDENISEETLARHTKVGQSYRVFRFDYQGEEK